MFEFKVDQEISLRLLEARGDAALFALVDANRKYLRRWMAWLDGTKAVADIAEFTRTTRQQFADNGGFVAGIWFRGELCGVVGHNHVSWVNRAGTLGYWLSADLQGRGIMTRACRAIVDYSFDELNLNRVEIRCASENAPSRAIPQRLGFTHEGTIRNAEWLYDKFVDHEIYGILKNDFLPFPVVTTE